MFTFMINYYHYCIITIVYSDCCSYWCYYSLVFVPPSRGRQGRLARSRGRAENVPRRAGAPRLKHSGKSPMGMRIPPLKLMILLESNPLKSRILVGKLAAITPWARRREVLPQRQLQPVGHGCHGGQRLHPGPLRGLDCRI